VDCEGLLIDYLTVKFGAGFHFSTILPPENEWDSNVMVRIIRASGAARSRFVDRPIVDIDVFTLNDATAAMNTALAIQDAMQFVHGREIDTVNGIVTMVNTIIGPRWIPDQNQEVFRRSATYELHTHSPTGAG
jgi:hypothetical protein